VDNVKQATVRVSQIHEESMSTSSVAAGVVGSDFLLTTDKAIYKIVTSLKNTSNKPSHKIAYESIQATTNK